MTTKPPSPWPPFTGSGAVRFPRLERWLERFPFSAGAIMPVGIAPGRPEPAPAKDKVEAEQQDDQHDNGHDHGENPHGAPPNIIRVHLLLLIQVLSLQLHPGYLELSFPDQLADHEEDALLGELEFSGQASRGGNFRFP